MSLVLVAQPYKKRLFIANFTYKKILLTKLINLLYLYCKWKYRGSNELRLLNSPMHKCKWKSGAIFWSRYEVHITHKDINWMTINSSHFPR